MSRFSITSIALAAALWADPPACAHDFWIEPSSYAPAPDEVVRVRLRVGQHFEGDPVPRQDELIDRFEIDGPVKRVPIVGEDGLDPAGFLRIDGVGTQVIVYQSRGSFVELPPGLFESYLRDEGLEPVIKERAVRGASGKHGRERFYRCAKALVVSGAASAQAPPRFGLTLEIIPRCDLTRLRPGDALPVTLVFRGRPLEGALVKLLDRGGPGRVSAARTDRRGEATLTLQGDGPHLVKAVWMEAARAGSDAEWESWWASMTFQKAAGR